MTTMHAQLEEFGHDAALWRDGAEKLAAAASAAANLTIPTLAFGLAWPLGVHTRYQEVQQMVVDRLTEGAEVFRSIADNLIRARDGIRAADEASDRAVRSAGGS